MSNQIKPEGRPLVTEAIIVNTLDLRDSYSWRFKSKIEVVQELADGRKVIVLARGTRIPPELALVQGVATVADLNSDELARCQRAVKDGVLDKSYLRKEK